MWALLKRRSYVPIISAPIHSFLCLCNENNSARSADECSFFRNLQYINQIGYTVYMAVYNHTFVHSGLIYGLVIYLRLKVLDVLLLKDNGVPEGHDVYLKVLRSQQSRRLDQILRRKTE